AYICSIIRYHMWKQPEDLLIVSHFEDLRRHKEYLEHRDLSIRKISEETGLSQGAILRVKNATMAMISLSTLESLCRYFSVKGLNELIEYVPGPNHSDAAEG